jgi:hypothetical protein
LFNDLEQDPELFTGEGLAKKGDLQFDIYRWMRKEVDQDWNRSCFKTNIYVLLSKLVDSLLDGQITRKIPQSIRAYRVESTRPPLQQCRRIGPQRSIGHQRIFTSLYKNRNLNCIHVKIMICYCLTIINGRFGYD